MKKFLVLFLVSTFSVSSSWAMFKFLGEAAERGARVMVKRYSTKGFRPSSKPTFKSSGRKLPKDVTFLGPDSELFVVNSEKQSAFSGFEKNNSPSVTKEDSSSLHVIFKKKKKFL